MHLDANDLELLMVGNLMLLAASGSMIILCVKRFLYIKAPVTRAVSVGCGLVNIVTFAATLSSIKLLSALL